MAFTPRPKLNDIIEKNPDQKHACMFSSVGKRLDNTAFPSWVYTVIYNNTEYVYFANAEYHAIDIDRAIQAGTPFMDVWMTKIEDEEGTHKSYRVQPIENQNVPTAKSNPKASHTRLQGFIQGDGKPDWDEIAKGKCRHAYALALFTEIIKKDGSATITSQHTRMIEGWVEYSMTGSIPVKNGTTLDREPF